MRVSLLVSTLLTVLFGFGFASAWTGPTVPPGCSSTGTASPPNCNVSAPVNLSSSAQEKAGSLTIDGSLTVDSTILSNSNVGANNLLLFATTPVIDFSGGASTTGIRDSGGTMQYLNNGGSWTSFASGASQWTTSGSSIYYTGGNVGIGDIAPGDPLDVTTGDIGAAYGVNGMYTTSAGSAFGSTVWSLNSTYDGTVSGSSYAPTSLYGMSWIRGTNASEDANVGEGLYGYTNGVQRWALGASGFSVGSSDQFTVTSSGNVTANMLSFPNGSSIKNAANSALTIKGVNAGGTGNDIVLQNDAGTTVLSVPYGTTSVTIANSITSPQYCISSSCITSWPSGGGSGTINSGTTNEVAYYTANGTTLGGASALSANNTSATANANFFVQGILYDNANNAYYLKPSSTSTLSIVTAAKYCIASSCITSWPSGGSSQWTTSGTSIYYNTGNVGIGTNAPTDSLDVTTGYIGAAYGANGMYTTSAGSAFGSNVWSLNKTLGGTVSGSSYAPTGLYGFAWIRSANASADSNVGEGLYGYTNGVQRWALGASGLSVGSSDQFTVTSSGNATANSLTFTSGSAITNAANSALTIKGVNNGATGNDIVMENDTGATVLNIPYGTTNVKVSGLIQATGNTSPTLSSQGAYIGWDAFSGSAGETDFMNQQGSGSAGGYEFYNSTTTSKGILLMQLNGTTGATVYNNVTADAFLYSSDERLKTDIEPMSASTTLAQVLALQPVSYIFKDPEEYGAGPQIGFIAQQVQQIIPQIVHTDASTTLESIDYSKLTPLLVGSVQELNATIQDQQTQIDQQQQEIDTLQQEVQTLENK